MRPELEAAMAAVAAAQAAIAEGGAERVTSKGGRDLVTAADVAAEDAIRRTLLQRYPDYPIVGEERGGAAPEDGLVDPICGTRVFACGIPLYAITVTLVQDGETGLCAVGDGSSGAIYTAERDGGAHSHLAGTVTPLRVSGASSVVWVDPATTRSGPWTPHAGRFIAAALLADRWYVWVLGTSLALAFLAAGRIAGFVHFASSALHQGAGSLLAREAGAVISDFSGRPATLDSQACVLAATPELHRDLLRLVGETRPGRAP
jgi:myo-inositol-1(or 4)-monophosphatase